MKCELASFPGEAGCFYILPFINHNSQGLSFETYGDSDTMTPEKEEGSWVYVGRESTS